MTHGAPGGPVLLLHTRGCQSSSKIDSFELEHARRGVEAGIGVDARGVFTGLPMRSQSARSRQPEGRPVPLTVAPTGTYAFSVASAASSSSSSDSSSSSSPTWSCVQVRKSYG